MASLLHCAHAQQGRPKQAINLQKWVKALIEDWDVLLLSLADTPHNFRINDKDVASEIATHLQSLGPCVQALDIIHYTDIPEVWA